MRVEYKRDMNHNYLILGGEQEVDTSSYQVRMLAGNVLPSILKCRLQGLDGEIMFCYEITSKQSLTSIYEEKKFGLEDLQLIFGGFVQVMEEMVEYLLNPDQIILDPNFIYIDIEKRSLYFCYLPGYEKELREQFQIFTEFILPKLDHEDSRAIVLGYGIYRRALEDSFHLEHMKQELYQVKDVEWKPKPRQEGEQFNKNRKCQDNLEIQETIVQNTGISGDNIKEGEAIEKAVWNDELWRSEDDIRKLHGADNKKRNNKISPKTGNKADGRNNMGMIRVLAGTAASVGIMLSVLTANLLGYLPWLSVEIALGAGVLLLGFSVLSYLISRNKSKKAEENWREKIRQYPEKEEVLKTDEDRVSAEKIQKVEIEYPSEKTGDFGETTVLSAHTASGPASFVSREPGELGTIYLRDDLTIIGKMETACDVVIPLPTVSRVHGKVRRRGEDYYLSDLNSRNGTSVNGRMLKGNEEYLLQDEDEVDFAQARYIFLAR